MLEEDLALPNMALDLIGVARGLYARAGEVEGKGRGEDDLAYFRGEREFRNCLLVERPNGDFAADHAAGSFISRPSWSPIGGRRPGRRSDAAVRGIAGKAVKEVAYHIRHAGEWVIRHGRRDRGKRRADGAGPSSALHRYTGELVRKFAGGAGGRDGGRAAGAGQEMRERLGPRVIGTVFAEAGLVAARRRSSCRPAGEPVCMAKTSATCWPRCSLWRGRIRGRSGEPGPCRSGAEIAGVGARSGDPGRDGRRSRHPAWGGPSAAAEPPWCGSRRPIPGCPAVLAIELAVEAALREAGIAGADRAGDGAGMDNRLDHREGARQKLRAYGIAPAGRRLVRRHCSPQPVVACPRCGSEATERVSEFGSTACKAQVPAAPSCGEPFDYFKCI